LGWTIWDQNRSGHSGATPGYYAVMMMEATEHGPIGIVVLQNIGCSLFCDQDWFTAGHLPVRERLLDEARRLIAEQT
jgi:hypothetical protein